MINCSFIIKMLSRSWNENRTTDRLQAIYIGHGDPESQIMNNSQVLGVGMGVGGKVEDLKFFLIKELMMMMIMIATFIVHDSINLNSQCVGGGGGGGGRRGRGNREKVIRIKEKEKDTKWVFRGLRNAAKESASLIVCGS